MMILREEVRRRRHHNRALFTQPVTLTLIRGRMVIAHSLTMFLLMLAAPRAAPLPLSNALATRSMSVLGGLTIAHSQVEWWVLAML